MDTRFPIEAQEKAPLSRLSPMGQRLVLHWGEMGTRWGVNRSVAQIHALLFFHGRPLDAEWIAETLGIARSNVSNSLRELINLKLAAVVHLPGQRRDHFETSGDVWALFRTVVSERKQREFDPTVALLQSCADDPAFATEAPEQRRRIRETLQLMQSLSQWGEQMLRLSPATLLRIMKLGSRIQKLLQDKPE